MNISYIGSCLSAQVVKAWLEQDPSAHFVAGLSQVRLDSLHEEWVENSDRLPDARERDSIVRQLEKAGHGNKIRYRLSWQTKERLSEFREALRISDCLLIDNNYDLAARTWEVERGKKSYRLANLQLTAPVAGFRSLGMADLGRSADVYRQLVDYIKSLNPALRIVFLQYPSNGFERAGAMERVRRTAAVAPVIGGLAGVKALPLIDVGPDHLTEKGAHYFSDNVYHTFASAARKLMSDAHTPRWQQRIGYETLQSWVDDGRTAADVGSRLNMNPYQGLPERQFWKPAVSDPFPLSISGLYDRKFTITRTSRVATFGSCFAQHIGRRLKGRGFNFIDLEPAPASLPRQEYAQRGYGIYSARYGNVYTSLQMLQLFRQAFGETSLEETWEHEGRFYDPLRPNIFPGGFTSPQEVLEERSRHLAIVRQIFETSELIIFTMGLTECWYNRSNGTAYPMAPGATVGALDSAVHGFRNLRFAEIHGQMTELLEGLDSVNPGVKVLLTVSPVPLTATYENRHVLVSTMHSKSVLRAVAGELEREHGNVDYFPSYEIIMSPPFRSMFFKSNLRNICEEGVDFVMSHFFRVHGSDDASDRETAADEADGEFCDEALLGLANEPMR